MILVISLLTILLFFLIVYSLLDNKFKSVIKFDLIFSFSLLTIFFARVFGILSNFSQFQTSFSLGILEERGDEILLFSRWPWIFFRLWDNVLSLEFIFLIAILSFFVLIYLYRRKIKSWESILSSFFISIILSFTLLYALQLVSKTYFFQREISFFSLDPLSSGIFINVVILCIVYFIRKYDSKAKLMPIILILWAIFNVLTRLTNLQYEQHINFIDLYYLEILVSFLIGIFYLLFYTVKNDKKNGLQIKENTSGDLLNRVRYKNRYVQYREGMDQKNKVKKFLSKLFSKNK